MDKVMTGFLAGVVFVIFLLLAGDIGAMLVRNDCVKGMTISIDDELYRCVKEPPK